MARSAAGKAFEVGVRTAIELFKNVDWSRLRQQLAESAEAVLEAAAKIKKP